MEVVRLRFACPIPEGHPVRIRWYLAPSRGAGPLRRRPHEPVVEDLQTGIRYAPGWTLHPAADPTVRELSQLVEDPPESLRAERTLTGKVLGTTVVHMPANTTHPVQTRLLVEPDLDRAPYR